MGTPYYMSPEQAKGAKGMDHRADLYAVGVILYECVTGRVPFNADTFNELLFKIVLETPQPIEQVVPDSDPEFNKLVQRGMAREPGLRYQTAREFQVALDAWFSGAPVAGAVLGTTPAPLQTGMPVLSAGSMGRATPAAISSAVLGSGPLPQGGTVSAVGPGPVVSAPLRTGTPGTWANNTGPSPFAEGPKKSSAPLIAATAIGVLLLVGGGFAAMKMSGGGKPVEPPAAAQPPGPTSEQLAEEAKRVAELAAREKEVEEKIKRAEVEARAAEDRAKKAEASSKEQAEAEEARERLKALKAAVPAPAAAKPAVKAAPPAASPSPAQKPPDPARDPQPGGRKIRTEL
jgi:serine/threonine-protein kinase